MSKTTFLGYVPSLKLKGAKATIVEGKAIESKGGSIRYTLRGEYKGRKTLPKTVTKADFEGVYGFDAKEAEAVYIKGNQDHNGVKNPQAIYHQVGKEDEEGFETTEIIPIENKEDASRVISREMHKDGRIIHNVLPKSADTVGSPSPASVEPPAPSEDPFPQEPSNASFSAESNVRVFVVSSVDYETDGQDLDLRQDFTFALDKDDIGDTTDMQEIADEIIDDISDETGFLVNGFYFQEKMPDGTMVSLDAEAYEAFGFGKEDEEEESEEPKTQEFTVVMQEGDKLELTDIEQEDEPKDEDNGEDEENDEKEAEMDKEILMICPSCDETVPEYSSCMSCGQQFGAEEGTRTFVVSSVDYETDDEDQDELDLPQDFTITLDGSDMKHLEQMEKEYNEEYPGEWPDYEMQEIADLMVDTISDESGWLVEGFYFEELMPDGTLKSFNAVQAKVTRPVKEEPKEEEDEEGMSTLMKVGLGVGALAVGAMVLGAEDEGESDYWAGENAEWRAENVSGDMDVGELNQYRRVRKDYTIDSSYDGDLEIGDIDLDSIGIADHFEDELTDAIRESVEDSLPLEHGDSSSGDIDVDMEVNMDVPLTGSVNYDWTSNESYEEDDAPVDDHAWNAETYEATKHHGKSKKRKGRADIHPRGRMSSMTDGEYQGVNNRNKANLEQQEDLRDFKRHGGAENFSAEDDTIRFQVGERYTHRYHHGYLFRDNEVVRRTDKTVWTSQVNPETGKVDSPDLMARHQVFTSKPLEIDEKIIPGRESYGLGKMAHSVIAGETSKIKYAETVGSPSPSGPSSVPEPAEATGSEPSNEHFSAPKKIVKSGTLCAVCNGNLDAGWFDCENCGMIVCGDMDGESGFVECQTLDGMCKDCHPKDENWKMNFGAESKNMNWVIGLTALGIGVAALGYSDKILALFDRFKK